MKSNVKIAQKLLRLARELVPNTGLDGLSNSWARKSINGLLSKFTKGFFHDDAWVPVHAIFDEMRKQNIDFVITSADYLENEKGIPSAKEWKLEISFTNDKGRPTKLSGIIRASGAGSVQDPLEKYDLVAYVN